MTDTTLIRDMLLSEFCTKKPKAPKKSKAAGQTTEKTVAQARLDAAESAERLLRTHWRATARVYHITENFCRKCHDTQSVVSTVLIRHVNVQGAIWERHREDVPANLPDVIVQETARIDECPTCLFDRIFDVEISPLAKKIPHANEAIFSEDFPESLDDVREDIPALNLLEN